jgi:hypothetical protein
MHYKLEFYIDLDNTLIHASYGGNPNKRRTKIDLLESEFGKREVYWSMLRPRALDFLAFCRDIAPTKMLTHSLRDYALKHNEVFGLGFSDNDVISRDDFSHTEEEKINSLSRPTKKAVRPNVIGVSPGAILVDDKSPKVYLAKIKIQYLGIGENRYVQSRTYCGGKDPENFDKEIDNIKKIIGFPFHKNSYTISA